MTKQEFNNEIDSLIQKVIDIKYDDSSSANSVIKEFKHFVSTHHKYLNQYVLEHIGIIEANFEEMRNAKNSKDKIKAWQQGCGDLLKDVSSMKHENIFPEVTIEN